MSFRASLLIAAACATSITGCKQERKEDQFQVAAAADLALAFGELGKSFEAKHNAKPLFTFGSTGLLAKQIGEGAPFSVFAAANESFVDEVIGKGKCDQATARRYARGRIVVWTAAGVKPPASLAELTEPRFKRISIANPEHAPYGRAGKQALEASGLWDQLEPRLVMGENVRATLQFAQTGNVDAAIVALSLSVATDGGNALLIDSSLHLPLDQALVVCGKGKHAELGKKFTDYVVSPEGQEVLTRYGFGVPVARNAEVSAQGPTPAARAGDATPMQHRPAPAPEASAAEAKPAHGDGRGTGGGDEPAPPATPPSDGASKPVEPSAPR
jgi:molybdate transport system substrate-binding protein